MRSESILSLQDVVLDCDPYLVLDSIPIVPNDCRYLGDDDKVGFASSAVVFGPGGFIPPIAPEPICDEAPVALPSLIPSVALNVSTRVDSDVSGNDDSNTSQSMVADVPCSRPDANDNVDFDISAATWTQSADSVDISIPFSGPINRKLLAIPFKPAEVMVTYDGDPVFSCSPCAAIVPDGSGYIISRSTKSATLEMELCKRDRPKHYLPWKHLSSDGRFPYQSVQPGLVVD